MRVEFHTQPELNVLTGERSRRQVMDIEVQGCVYTLPLDYNEAEELIAQLQRAVLKGKLNDY